MHAAVYGDVPGCTNAAYLVDDGAFLHPGDSFAVPAGPTSTSSRSRWTARGSSSPRRSTTCRRVQPRVAVPVHEGETTDPAKYAGMLAAFSPEGVVRIVPRAEVRVAVAPSAPGGRDAASTEPARAGARVRSARTAAPRSCSRRRSGRRRGRGADVELVRLDELRLPSGTAEGAEPDDAWWLWERLVDCDGLIVSTPIMSRTVAARLKLLGDRLLGPNADAAIIEGLLALRASGTGAGRPLPRRRAGAEAAGGRLPRGGRLADVAVEDAGPADDARDHVLDAHRRGRPGAVRGCRHSALDRPGRPPRSTGRRCSGATSPVSSGCRSTRPATSGRRDCARCATSTSLSCAARTSSARRAARGGGWRRT